MFKNLLIAFIVLCSPGVYAQTAPQLTSFTPTEGGPGTVVTLKGDNFLQVIEVVFADTPASFTVVDNGTMTVTIPEGAQSGIFILLTETELGFSEDIFTVLIPDLFFYSFDPKTGPPGTTVTLFGEFEEPENISVLFNDLPAAVHEITNNTIVTTVPEGAQGGAWIILEQNGVFAEAPEQFLVTEDMRPAVTLISPLSGAAGTTVTINGDNLGQATLVTLAGITMEFEVSSDEQILALIPEGAASGVISVTTPAGTAQSASSFEILLPPPAIESFSPTTGGVGTTVTITGIHFDGNKDHNVVKFNDAVAEVTSVTATAIVVAVPTGATTGKVSVTTNGGTATSTDDFTVTAAPDAPVITLFTPPYGTVGTPVTIEGKNFTEVTSLKLGDKDISFEIESSTSITTTIPDGASTGKFTVTSSKGTGQSVSSFLVRSADGKNGTYLIKDIVPGANGSAPDRLRVAGGLVYFNVREYGKPTALFRSDGTEAGTYRIKENFELPPADYWSQRTFADFNDNLIFSYNGEIWISDGTESGTRELYDLDLKSAHYTYHYTPFNGSLYFIYRGDGKKCYKWDGSNFQLIYQTASTLPLDLVPAGNKLFLIEEMAIYDVTNGTPVKVFDQAEENKQTGVSRLLGAPFIFFNGMVVYNDKTSGGTEGTVRGIKYFNPSTNTVHRIVSEGKILRPSATYSTFACTSSDLIFSSGSAGGSGFQYKLLKINSNFQLSVLKEMVFSSWGADRAIISNGAKAIAVIEPHTILLTDGTPEGTQVLIDDDDGITLNLEQSRFHLSKSKLFFAGSTTASGYELFTIDIEGGHVPVPVEFGQKQFGNCCSELVSIREEEVITGAARHLDNGNSAHGNELWASDGSPIIEEPCLLSKPELHFDGTFLSFTKYKGTYEWYRNGLLLTGEDGLAIKPLFPGSYTLIVVVDGCKSPRSDPYNVEGTVTSTEADLIKSINVFPNPSSGTVTISISNHAGYVRGLLADQLGRTIGELTFTDEGNIRHATVDMSNLTSGLYYCKISTSTGSTVVKVFKKPFLLD